MCHCNVSGDSVWLNDGTEEAEIRLGGFEDSHICKTGQHIPIRAGRTQYLAPEVFVGHSAFPVDIWAFATVVYRLLSGRFPFAGDCGEAKLMFQLCVFYQSPITASPDLLALTCRKLNKGQHFEPAEQARFCSGSMA